MTAKRKPKAQPQRGILAGRIGAVHVERGGVSIQVVDVPAAHAVSVAVAILRALKAHEAEFPALLPPQEVVQIGGYTPVPVDDDGTYARRVGFEAS